MVTEDNEKATLLNGYFSSVFTRDDSILPEFKRRVSDNISLEQIEFLPANILKAVKQIKNKRSLDPNGLSSGFIKKISSPLVKPLCVLFSCV